VQKILAIAIALTLTACATQTSVQRTTQSSARLTPNLIAYVSVPQDGAYGNKPYIGSGRMATEAVAAAFVPHMARVEQAPAVQSAEDARIAANEAGAAYLIEPTIMRWEDRATEWSGISDKASVQVRITDPKTGAVLDSAVINGKSSYWTMGGDHPQDLLPGPMKEYADSLF